MLPLFRKITDNAQYLKVTRAEVAVLGRVEGNRSDTIVHVLIGTTLEPKTTARVDFPKKLGVRNTTIVDALRCKTVESNDVANYWDICRVGTV